VQHLTGEIASSDISTEEALNTSTGSTEKASDDVLWQVAFDQKVAEMTSKRTPISDAMVETHQYLEQKNIVRKEDPLWWQQNGRQYPKCSTWK